MARVDHSIRSNQTRTGSNSLTKSQSRSSSTSKSRPQTPISDRSSPQTGTTTPFPTTSSPGQLNNWKEDLFGDGLPFYDLLVSLDAHLDLFKRRTIDPIKLEWETRSKPIKEEWKARAKEAQLVIESTFNHHHHHEITKQNQSSDSISSFSTGFSIALSEAQKRTLKSSIERERELREFAERELREFKEKLKIRRDQIQSRWNDSKTVSLREKASFFFSVNNVLGTALLLAFWPEYIPLSYTLQAAYYLPLRIYTYRKQAYHYFLFDLCYVVNGLTLLFLWIWPSNALLFQACYGLAHGPSAFAIATWRNSLVFHSVEKVTSLFIHIYPALVFTVIRHFDPNASKRYPALNDLQTISVTRTLIICSTVHIVWQTLYYRYVIIARAKKIEAGGRPTSFTYLLNSKSGLISKLLKSIKPENRANSFMISQYFYTLLTILPSLLWFFNSKTLSGLFLWIMFSVSVWNGASFYMEVFGRRFEKELNALRKDYESLNRDSVAIDQQQQQVQQLEEESLKLVESLDSELENKTSTGEEG
ncbi:hypothetical protein CROQUDRAFT_106857 [Cronartium quercuum f. sp. fusiforme G11]|uniref:Glycerophosphocholine acyltransferase 1 n=1 Tax=Cronartium quercuum f. sp. fusiforme G11 TaxID=708437 RepID=A0A9P6NNR2_9BASI|nr:hypothetical protein CROQUDRAFT_106857 [Cronartium quercuum f. sp. fusiforme G11]